MQTHALLSCSPNGDDGDDDHDDAERVRPRKRPKRHSTSSDPRFREVGLMRGGTAVESASFIGSASGIHFIRSVYGALGDRATSERSVAAETPDSNLVPGEDDRLARTGDGALPKSLWQVTEVAQDDLGSRGQPFSFDELMGWAASYFDVWHPAFPFLHAPSLLETWETWAQHGIPQQDSLDLVIAKSILCIALADRRQSGGPWRRPVPKSLVFNSFDEAMDSTRAALTQPATTKALQAIVSVQLFLVSMLRLNAASRLGGLVIRMAFQLGLHRCPTRFSAFSDADQLLRRRLFWSLYCIDRHICQAVGLPLSIRDDDLDVCYPDKERHPVAGAVGAPTSGLHPQPGTEMSPTPLDERLRLFTLLSRHAEIKGLVMELRNKRVERREENAEKVVHINAKLSQWWNRVGDAFEQAEYQDLPFSPLQKAVLTTLKHESTISLNRPILAAARRTADYSAALHTCISASKSIIAVLYALGPRRQTSGSAVGERGTEPCPPLFWPSFTWAVWMSAFIILYAALEREVDCPVAIRITDRALEILSRLESRGSVWPGACAVAIRDLRSTLNQTQANLSLRPPSTVDSSARSDAGLHGGAMAPDAGAQRNGERNTLLDKPSNTPHRQHVTSDSQMGPSLRARTPTSASLRGSQSSFRNTNASTLPHTSQGSPLLPWENEASMPISQHEMYSGPQQLGWPESAVSSDAVMGRSWPDLRSMDFNADLAAFSNEGLDPLQGFDIPFWIGQDNYTAWTGD